MNTSLAVFLHSHEYDRLHQAVGMVLSGASMGWTCHLFLFYQALASYLDDEWDITDTVMGGRIATEAGWAAELREGWETANLPSLYEMLEKAKQEDGQLTVYACSSSVRLLGLDTQVVRRKVDEIVGLPTMLKIGGGATHMVYV